MRLENLQFRWCDSKTTHQVLQIEFINLAPYFQSMSISSYLFPSNRIVVDIVPYQLMESNLALMNEYSGTHTAVFSDVRVENGTVRGLLSFGTVFRTQKVSFVYSIEMYGTDAVSIQRHITRHLSALQQNTCGSVCLMVFVQNDFPQKVADELCLKYGMSRVNYTGTQYTQWNFKKEIVIESDFKHFLR